MTLANAIKKIQGTYKVIEPRVMSSVATLFEVKLAESMAANGDVASLKSLPDY